MSDKMSIIGESVVIMGNLSGKGDLTVAGSIEGEVNLGDNEIIVEPNGSIEGNVKTQKITIAGEVRRGKIEATESTQVTETGKVYCDITTKTMGVKDGAVLYGEFNIGK